MLIRLSSINLLVTVKMATTQTHPPRVREARFRGCQSSTNQLHLLAGLLLAAGLFWSEALGTFL
jgi:hypothetical protein